MRELFTIVRAVFDLALTKGTDAARTLALIRRPNFNATRGEVYLRALWRLTAICLVIPLPLMVFGFIGGDFAKVAAPIAAILWSVVTIALAIVASPLGMVVGFLKGGVADLGERYVRFVGNVLFIEYSIAFLVSTIPLRNNPGGVPLLLVVLTLLVLAGVFTKRWVVKMAVAALPLLLLSFFSPPIFRAVNTFMTSLEGRAADTIEEAGEQLRKDDGAVTSRRVSPNSTLRMVRGSGDTFDVTLDTDWTQVDLKRDHRVPDGTEINFYPQIGEVLYLRSRGITYRCTNRTGKWEKQESDIWIPVTRIPDLAPDPYYFRVDRPANARPDWQPTMTVKLF